MNEHDLKSIIREEIQVQIMQAPPAPKKPPTKAQADAPPARDRSKIVDVLLLVLSLSATLTPLLIALLLLNR